MKRVLILLGLSFLITTQIQAQDVKSALGKFAGISAQQADSIKRQIINEVFENPALYNDAYAKFLASYNSDSSRAFNFMRELNVKFKTFQANQQPSALGLTYNYQNSWTKTKTKPTYSSSQTYSLNFSGNATYNPADNPANFLESNFNYNASFIWGGKVKPLDSLAKIKFGQLQQQLLAANIAGNTSLMNRLYLQRSQFIKTTNQFYIGINGDFNYETNQQFTKRQFVPGALVNLGAKAWNPKEALLYFNIPDYPFALIRLITGTDNTFTLSGASFPSALIGIEQVIPDQDETRETVTGNLNPYNRFRTEVSFKTKFARLGSRVIYFLSDFRYYSELNPSAAVVKAGLNRFVYFAASLEAVNGFFVSYTAGRLPFDQRNSNVYGLGFHYNFGNRK